MSAHDIPLIKDELERKTIEEVQRLCHDRKTCRISPEQFRSSMRTLWNCASGLVDSNTMDLISQISNQAVLMPDDMGVVQVYREEPTKALFVLRWRYGEPAFTLTRIAANGERKTTRKEVGTEAVQPAQDAFRAMLQVAARLNEAKYFRVL